jgi:putative transposase
LIRKRKHTKAALARQLGISRASLYYVSKQLPKDWKLKTEIERAMADHPGYGSPRIAQELHRNRKPVQRVMRLFGMKAYRRRGRKFRKSGVAKQSYPNLLKTRVPQGPHDVWVADFTYVPYAGKFIYLATVMDIVTREIVGAAVMSNHSVSLVLQALFAALAHHARPTIFHSDNGREYGSNIFTRALVELGIFTSRSAKSSPWENGYQEAFYSQFKVDLGDPNRFRTLGELVYEIHRLIWDYNHRRIHSALKMPPILFAERCKKLSENLSNVWGH